MARVDDRIEVLCDSRGVTYCSTRERLIAAGIATAEMFPSATESWRGNGPFRQAGEPLWSIQKVTGNRYRVLWELCTEFSLR